MHDADTLVLRKAEGLARAGLDRRKHIRARRLPGRKREDQVVRAVSSALVASLNTLDLEDGAREVCADAVGQLNSAQSLGAPAATRVMASTSSAAARKVATASPRQLRNALAVASELVGGELRPQGAAAVPTFKQIGEQWTSGELAKQYPDQIRVKRSAHSDFSRLSLYVYPVLQDIPINRVTLEGMREGEALALTWADLDLARGAVRLDKNKTDDPRAWALNPGVADALRMYKERHRPQASPESFVFVDPEGQPHSRFGLADLLRAHLVEIGLVRERPELFTTTPERRRIRVHDLRDTFVTLSLAAGRSESWISDRTGHRSSQMIARYKRNARTFAELDLGELAPLVGSPARALHWAAIGPWRRSQN